MDGGKEGRRRKGKENLFPKWDVVEKVSILGKPQVRRSAMPP